MASSLDRSKEHVAADQQIKRLQYQLSQRSKDGDKLVAVSKEKEQVEELLLQTQRENERCEEDVKRWKAYARGLEQQIEKLAGTNWQQRLDIPPTPGGISLHASLCAPTTPVGGLRRGADDATGWLGNQTTPVTAFKTSRMFGRGTTSISDLSHSESASSTLKRSASTGLEGLEGIEVNRNEPEVKDPAATGLSGGAREAPKQADRETVKGKRRTSAFDNHEEMVLPAVQRHGSLSPASLQDGWTAVAQHPEEPVKIGGEDATPNAPEPEPPVKVAPVATSPVIPAPVPAIDDKLAKKILEAVKSISANQSAAAKDAGTARKQQAAAQAQFDADNARRQADMKRFVEQQRIEMKGYISDVEAEAEQRADAIREMMRAAQIAAEQSRVPHSPMSRSAPLRAPA